MASFESFHQPKQQKAAEVVREAATETEMKREEMQDYLFDQYMKQQLLEDFFEQLEEYLDPEVADEMRGALAENSDQDIYAALSLPHELRDRTFEQFEKQIEAGKHPKELMQGFVDRNKKYGFSIGYHTSPNDIKPSEAGEWTIVGMEHDHRDDDLSRAYYSTKYRHLFKKKDPKFIYIVRTDPATHQTDGNWNRAGMLSVVSRVPFGDVVEYVEDTVRDIEKKKTNAERSSGG